jgi:hypothetical protein
MPYCPVLIRIEDELQEKFFRKDGYRYLLQVWSQSGVDGAGSASDNQSATPEEEEDGQKKIKNDSGAQKIFELHLKCNREYTL